jgi:hypothetical protein
MQEHGARTTRPLGEDPVRAVYAGGALYLDTILDCLQNLAGTLTPETTHYAVEALARAAMEAGAVLFWLLQPGIGARMRVARLAACSLNSGVYLFGFPGTQSRPFR